MKERASETNLKLLEVAPSLFTACPQNRARSVREQLDGKSAGIIVTLPAER
jgi:hypothetical protein